MNQYPDSTTWRRRDTFKWRCRNEPLVATRKTALVCATALVVVLVAVEVAVRVYNAVADGELQSAAPLDAQAAPLARDGSGERRHPYMAFTTAASGDERNSYPPHPGGSGMLVVGVFGGGMAADMTLELKRALAARLSRLGVDVEPVVLAFAQDGGQQPQQLMTAINRVVHGAHLDVVVNLDGLHEMNWRRDHTLAHFPRLPATTASELRLMAEIAALRELRQDILATRHGALGASAAFGLFMDRRLDELQSDLRQREDRLAVVSASYSLQRDGPRREWSAHRQVAAAARQWYRSSMLLAEIAKASGAHYYHFLQPDAQALGKSETNSQYAAMRPMLVELGLELTRHGVAFFDLADAFAADDGARREDECCRLTQRRRELLAASVLHRIAPAVDALGRSGDVARGRAKFARDSVVADELLASAHYDVYRRGSSRLVYKRADCAEEDMQPPFFLHVMPLRGDDLDPRAAGVGFENMDFDFLGNGGVRVGGRCIVEQRLPDYPIEYLHTGQYDAATHERHWLTWAQLDTVVAPFKVFRARFPRWLVYLKRDCTAEDVHWPFMLHVLAVPDADDSDFLAMSDGYVNMDFEVAFADVVRSEGSCSIRRKLPFDFVRLRTGQFDPATFDLHWRREIERG